jgi:predicted adenine nucleotide alpha hydrolase (AANH) superfamily ATPase
MEIRDKIIESVVKKFIQRSDVGYKKYGITLHKDDQPLDTWLQHIQEELMDAVNYIDKKLKKHIQTKRIINLSTMVIC